MNIKLNVNGEVHDVSIKPYMTLLDVLRDIIKLKGTKKGCGTGGCGACTVLIDEKPVNSCLTFAASVQGKKILTIEGLLKEGELHPLQKSLAEHGAFQCGYCAPGMIMSLSTLFNSQKLPEINEEKVKETITGHICRCTGYVAIVDATLAAAREIKGG